MCRPAPDVDGEEYYPMLKVAIEAATAGVSAMDVARSLKTGRAPPSTFEESAVEQGILYIDSLNLQDRDTAEIVGRRCDGADARCVAPSLRRARSGLRRGRPGIRLSYPANEEERWSMC